MTDVKEVQGGMSDVVSLTEKADTALQTKAAKALVSERNEKVSQTPVFDAVVREWRAEGREIPLRRKSAVPAQNRDAA
jgi:hypothetical protein